MSLPNPEEQGTIQSLILRLIMSGDTGTLIASRLVMNAGDDLEFFRSGLLAGPERTADRLRKLSRAEVAALRNVFQQALDAIDELPPHAFKREGLTVVKGGQDG